MSHTAFRQSLACVSLLYQPFNVLFGATCRPVVAGGYLHAVLVAWCMRTTSAMQCIYGSKQVRATTRIYPYNTPAITKGIIHSTQASITIVVNAPQLIQLQVTWLDRPMRGLDEPWPLHQQTRLLETNRITSVERS
jgi:hypothetical protein